MAFSVFNNPLFEFSSEGSHASLLQTLRTFREESTKGTGILSGSDVCRRYADICNWTIRLQEYAFVEKAISNFSTRHSRSLNILDAGCGVSPISNWLSLLGHQVTSLDLDQANLRILERADINRLFSSQVNYVCGRLEALPFASESFDCVICVSVFEHLIPGMDSMAVDEFARILSPSGLFVLTCDWTPEGEVEISSSPRRYGTAYDLASLVRLREDIFRTFKKTDSRRLGSLKSLSRDDVHRFWESCADRDNGRERVREYLAVGDAFTKRRRAIHKPTPRAVSYAISHRSLISTIDFFKEHAERRGQATSRQAAQLSSARKALSDFRNKTSRQLSKSIRNRETARELRNHLQSKESALEELRDDLGRATNKLQDTISKLAALENDYRSAQLTIEQLNAINARLQRTEGHLREKIRSAQTEFHELQAELESRKITLERKTDELHRVSALLERSDERIDSYRAEIHDLKSDLAAAAALIRRDIGRLRGFTRQLNQLASQATKSRWFNLVRSNLTSRRTEDRRPPPAQEQLAPFFESNFSSSEPLQSLAPELGNEHITLGRALARLRRSVTSPLSVQFASRVFRSIFQPRLGQLIQYPPRPVRLPKVHKSTLPDNRLPAISIVTPSFNSGPFIRATLESIRSQDYPNLEVIVQDGNSTDNTRGVLSEVSFRGMRWQSQPDGGQAHAINLGFADASGDILAYLNADDLLLPGALNFIADFFVHHPEVDVIYGHRILIDDQGDEIGRWILPTHDNEVLKWADYVPQETMFWRRRIWTKIGERFDESFEFALDWDLILRFIESGARITRVNRFLGAFRVHRKQKTQATMISAGAKEMAAIRHRIHNRVVTNDECLRQISSYLRKHLIFHWAWRLGLLRC